MKKSIIISLFIGIITFISFQKLIIPQVQLFQPQEMSLKNIVFLLYPISAYVLVAFFIRSIVNIYNKPQFSDLFKKLLNNIWIVLAGVFLGPWATVILGIIAGIYIGIKKN